MAIEWICHQRPLFRSMFKINTLVPMEELPLGQIVFGSSMFYVQMHLPTYEKWFRNANHEPMERCVRLVLQIIQHQRGNDKRLWILKSPQNSDTLAAKARVWPRAKFVLTHRKAEPVIKSVIALTTYMMGIFNDLRRTDLPAFCDMWVQHQRWALVDKLSREEINAHVQPPRKLFNVLFEEFMAGPVGLAMRVAEHAGLDASMGEYERMSEFARVSPREGSNVLVYDLQSFGIQKEDVEREFMQYELEYVANKTSGVAGDSVL